MLNTDTGEIIPEPPPALPDKPADPGDAGRSPEAGDAGRSSGMPRIERCDVPTTDESEPPPEAEPELSADQLAEAEYQRKERERAEAWYRLRLNARIFGYG
jgi:hypothetical protein